MCAWRVRACVNKEQVQGGNEKSALAKVTNSGLGTDYIKRDCLKTIESEGERDMHQ